MNIYLPLAFIFIFSLTACELTDNGIRGAILDSIGSNLSPVRLTSHENHDHVKKEDSIPVNGVCIAGNGQVTLNVIGATPRYSQVSCNGGSFTQMLTPTLLNGFYILVQVSQGSNHDKVLLDITNDSPIVNIFSNESTYVALKADKTIEAWGQDWYSPVAPPVKNVVHVAKTMNDFAALTTEGKVVSWAGDTYGCAALPTGATATALESGVVNVIGNECAFAALKDDGSVVTWGHAATGGDSSAVASELASGVVKLYGWNSERTLGTDNELTHTFAALKSDGSVVAWGAAAYGGDTSVVASDLASGVVDIFPNLRAFAALKSDGSVITWGEAASGGSMGTAAANLASGVEEIFGNGFAYAALKDDGSVVTWGNTADGGDSSSVAADLTSGVIKIVPRIYGGFIALKSDGSVIHWGSTTSATTTSSNLALDLSSGVIDISASYYGDNMGFGVAVKAGGSLVLWGGQGGDALSETSYADPFTVDLSSGVTDIYPLTYGMAVKRSDGSASFWGSNFFNSAEQVSSLSSNVKEIFSNGYSAMVLKEDDQLIGIGMEWTGGFISSKIADHHTNQIVKVFNHEEGITVLNKNGHLVSSGPAGLYIFPETVTDVKDFAIAETYASFSAVLKNDGSVAVYGDQTCGADISSIASEVSSGVASVYASQCAGAALKDSGKVVAWGLAAHGGDASSIATDLNSGITKVYAHNTGFMAVNEDGKLLAWGDGPTTNIAGVSASLASGVEEVVIAPGWSSTSFAAIKTGGEVITWGTHSSADTELSSGITKVVANTCQAFAALKDDGTVITWGSASGGGDSSGVSASLVNVSDIQTSYCAFAALKGDGSVIAWGDTNAGGSTAGKTTELSSGVVRIYPAYDNFIALKEDASLVIWPAGHQADQGYTDVLPQLGSGVSEVYSSPNSEAILLRTLEGHFVPLGLSLGEFPIGFMGVSEDFDFNSDITVQGANGPLLLTDEDGNTIFVPDVDMLSYYWYSANHRAYGNAMTNR